MAAGAFYHDLAVLETALCVRPEVVETVPAKKFLFQAQADIIAHPYFLGELHVPPLQLLVLCL